MPGAENVRDARHLEMIETMTQCAFELGVAAGEIAKRAADDTRRFLAASAEFRHCFFAVRMGIRLAQATRAGVVRAAAPVERLERERSDADPPERDEALDGLDVEREREGDYEPVSLPAFLKTLRGVTASAEQRRDDLPPRVRDTVLPTLRNLLDQVSAPGDARPGRENAASAVAVLARPPAGPASRSRLLTSTVTPDLRRLRPAAPRRRDSG